MSELVVEGLSISIRNRAIVANLSLTVGRGELVALMGPNGAGKTTALRAILGLVPSSAGRIEVDGKDVRAMSAKERARRIAYLPQSRDVFWPISARTLVGLGRVPHGDDQAPSGARAIAASLAAVDATRFAGQDVRTLSGGELARVLFARALAVGAGVLLADEPVAALDPGHQLIAMEHLALAAQTSSVLVVMHDLSLAARFCNRIYLLDQGRIVASGPALDVIASPALESAFGIRLLRNDVEGVPLLAPVHAHGDRPRDNGGAL